ncbi:MAG: sulfurtransferase [Bacteroidetes bacterium]|nr:sulfurtransferase [Bacteroidota bacterium]MCW5896499.1 sulfurtransferase [Bacteroidota bacterium]
MSRFTASLAVLVLTTLFPLHALHATDGKPSGHILVTTEWLHKHLQDPSLVILHVAFAKGEYYAGHIPGARLVPWQSIVTPPPQPPGSGLTSELPPVSQLDSLFKSAGVSDNSHVVIYGAVVSAARLFWTLEQIGFAGKLSVLDGGLDAWREEKRPLSTEIPEVQRGTLTTHPRSDVVVNADWIMKSMNSPSTRIVDARLPHFYVGADSGGMARAGHVPGAVNIPYTSLLRELSKYRDYETLKMLFRDAEVKEGEQVVAYCHVGQTASVVYFAARLLGHDVRIYDGSFQDWARRTELPLDIPMRVPPK